MKPYRSMLFVPGHKTSWVEKAVASGADALILDLEDSVPPGDKSGARKAVRDTIERLRESAIRADVWVRPNPVESGLFDADLDAIVVEGLAGLFLPKVGSSPEIVGIDAVVSHLEAVRGIPRGDVGLIASFETARSMVDCDAIAGASPRVVSLLGATGPNADVARELGFEFSAGGLESLYLRSRILMAARANGIDHPIGGLWQDIPDLDGLRRFAEDGRRLGYRGMIVIHPTHVPVVNDVFTPSPETVDYCRRMLDAFQHAEAAGSAAVDFEGRHIDIAHVKTATAVLALAEGLSSSAEHPQHSE